MSTTIYHLYFGQEASGLRSSIEKAAAGSPVTPVSVPDYLADRKDSEPGCVIVELTQADHLAEISPLAFGTIDALPVIAITGAGGPSAESLLEAGAFAVVSGDCEPAELQAKIERALDYDRKSRDTRLRAKNSQIASKRLTQRQASIVRKLLEGMGNKGIAFDLGLSTRTIEIERAAILKLFGVGNAIELAHHVGQYEGMACCAARYLKHQNHRSHQHESSVS